MDTIKKFFKKDRFAAYCCAEIIDVKPGYARCSMKLTENHLNALGMVMGGAIFTLADFAFAVAANSHGTPAVSLNALINYIKPAKGHVLYAVAKEISRSRTIGIYQIVVSDEDDQTIATVTGTCFIRNNKNPD